MNSAYSAHRNISNLLAALLIVPLILVTNWTFAFYSVGSQGHPGGDIVLQAGGHPTGNYPRKSVDLRGQMRRSIDSVKKTIKLKGIHILVLSDITTNLTWWGLSLWLPTYLIMAKGFTDQDLIWAASIPYVGGVLGLIVGSTLDTRTGRLVEIAMIFGILSGAFIFLVIPIADFIVIIFFMTMVFFLHPSFSRTSSPCCRTRSRRTDVGRCVFSTAFERLRRVRLPGPGRGLDRNILSGTGDARYISGNFRAHDALLQEVSPSAAQRKGRGGNGLKIGAGATDGGIKEQWHIERPAFGPRTWAWQKLTTVYVHALRLT